MKNTIIGLTVDGSSFLEVISFDTAPDIDMDAFDKTNQQVETDFTIHREGSVKRLTGVDENGKQVVAVYSDTKDNSNQSLHLFMDAPISKKFMGMMDQPSIAMGRFQNLKS